MTATERCFSKCRMSFGCHKWFYRLQNMEDEFNLTLYNI